MQNNWLKCHTPERIVSWEAKGLTTNHISIQLDPCASKLPTYNMDETGTCAEDYMYAKATLAVNFINADDALVLSK